MTPWTVLYLNRANEPKEQRLTVAMGVLRRAVAERGA